MREQFFFGNGENTPLHVSTRSPKRIEILATQLSQILLAPRCSKILKSKHQYLAEYSHLAIRIATRLPGRVR